MTGAGIWLGQIARAARSARSRVGKLSVCKGDTVRHRFVRSVICGVRGLWWGSGRHEPTTRYPAHLRPCGCSPWRVIPLPPTLHIRATSNRSIVSSSQSCPFTIWTVKLPVAPQNGPSDDGGSYALLWGLGAPAGCERDSCLVASPPPLAGCHMSGTS